MEVEIQLFKCKNSIEHLEKKSRENSKAKAKRQDFFYDSPKDRANKMERTERKREQFLKPGSMNLNSEGVFKQV